MQSITLVIPGEYYDSQIYSGKLYLWGIDGTLLILNWEYLIDRIIEKQDGSLQFAIHCALRKGSYLYGREWQLFSHDREMYNLLLARFQTLSSTPIQIDQQDLDDALIKKSNSPFAFPHSDAIIFHDHFYVGALNGLQISRSVTDSDFVDVMAPRVWDGPSLSIAGSHYTLAIASGSDGLYESPIPDFNHRSNRAARSLFPQQLSSKAANVARWLYPSIYGSSHLGGYLADFAMGSPEEQPSQTNEQITDEDGTDEESAAKTKSIRIYRDTYEPAQIFTKTQPRSLSRTYSWGVRDKICYISDSMIEVVRYTPETPSKRKSDQQFMPLGSRVEDNIRADTVVSADSASFGIVIETNDDMYVIDSNGQVNHIGEAPINWRVFPDSRHYINHLHVVNDDHMSIYSFTNDYFIDQNAKRYGISVYRR